jgi:hypothetical protein
MATLALALLAMVATAAADPACWYNALCPYSETQEKQYEIDTLVETTLEDQMLACQALCIADNTDTGTTDCQHFSVHSNRGVTKCFLLAECADASSVDVCLTAAFLPCNSGPLDCVTNNNCDVLDANTMMEPGKIEWQCDEVNPYSQQVSEGKTCFLSCNSWVDGTGLPAMIASTCNAGVFDASVVVGALAENVPALPAALPVPTDLAADQVPCGCATYNMEWEDADTGTMVDYDPNTLPGTDFICAEDYIDMVTDPADWQFILTTSNTCRLFCDSYHVATMACENGVWTGQPELGAW